MRKSRQLTLWGTIVAFISACAGCRVVGPNYTGPPAAAIASSAAAHAPFKGAGEPAFSPEPAANRWWRLYDSETLDHLIDAAFTANTDLRMAAANLQRSRALLQEVKATREPMAAVNFDPSFQQLSVESYLHSGPFPALGLYETGVAVSYDLDLFGRLRRAVEAAAADDDAVKAAYDLTKVTVAAETARAYADVCNAGEKLAVVHRTLQLYVQTSDTVQSLVSAGRAPSVDYARAAAQVASTRANIPTLEAQRTNALYRLAALTGHPPAEYPLEVGECVSAPRVRTAIPIGDGAALLRRRPDVREAERRLAASVAQIGVATASLYPDITLGVSMGSTGALRDFLSSATNRYGVGLAIHWQANQDVARSRVAQANAAGKLALALFDGVVLAALRDTESALSTYSLDLQREEELTTARAREFEAQEQAQQLYVGGKTGFLTLLEAERDLASADDALASLHAQLATDQVALFFALGGGWDS